MDSRFFCELWLYVSEKELKIMPKTRQASPERDVLGRYVKQCGALIHNQSDTCSVMYNVQKGKQLKRSTKDYLEQNQIVKKTPNTSVKLV